MPCNALVDTWCIYYQVSSPGYCVLITERNNVMYSVRDITKVTELSNGEIQNAFIDSRELENARLALSRALGLPEPELYHDEVPLVEEDNIEEKLNKVIEIQERMAKGMLLIGECEQKINNAKAGHRLPYEVFMGWVDRRSKLWNHWFKLKGECIKIIDGDAKVWVEFFRLKDSELNRYLVSGETDKIDDQPLLHQTQNEVLEEILIQEEGEILIMHS